MIMKCKNCGKEFEGFHKRVYCSKECYDIGKKAQWEKNRKRKNKFKTYKQIQEENRKRKVEDGWRGRKMQGSGIIPTHYF